MTKGIVKKWDDTRGFGFITRDKAADVFVHYTQVDPESKGRKRLVSGDVVEFELVETPKGAQAQNVKIVHAAGPR